MSTTAEPSPLASKADPLGAFEETLSNLQSARDDVFLEAYGRLLSAPLPRRLAFLEYMLQSAQPETRQEAAILLGSTIAPQSESILNSALEREGDAAVQRAMHIARVALHAARAAAQWPLPEPPAYVLPPDEALGEDALTLLSARREKLIADKRERAADLRAQFGERAEDGYAYAEAVKASQDLDAVSAEEVLAILDGRSTRRRFTDAELALINSAPRLWTLPRFGLRTAVRLLGASNDLWAPWCDKRFLTIFVRLPVEFRDLRALDDVYLASGFAFPYAKVPERGAFWKALPAERIWPLFSRYPLHVIHDLLLHVVKRRIYLERQSEPPILTAATYPWLQPDWLSPLLAMAFGKYCDNRQPAWRLLARQPMLGRSLGVLLASPRSELRALAADRLKDLADPEMRGELRQALAREKADEVRARLLAALERLGEDLSPFLSKAALLRDAEAGLATKKPSNSNWFPFDSLPACRWNGGGDVDPLIVRWWVMLAWRLNDASGNALLDRYLELITPVSQSQLGSFILRAFLAHDTRPPSESAVFAYAEEHLRQIIASRQRYQPTTRPVVSDQERETLLTEYMRKKRRRCVGSAIGAKGILALAARAPGQELASRTRTFLRDHHTRLGQIEALLELLAHSGAPAALQVLLAVSHHFRKTRIQERAGELIEAIALRHGWTEQQLADRSVPTAGFDDNGEQTLDYGERVFHVSLDGALQAVLKNAEGKVLKALPVARAAEDPELVKAAKAQFSNCKAELKQVIDQQRAELREAMCAGRVWTVGEWQELIMAHPILGRLAQQLIWQEVDASGAGRRHFRPGVDRLPIDTEDDVVELDKDALVRLAHGTMMSAADAEAWTAHLWDYKVTPFFPQINRPTPPFDAANPPFAIDNPLRGTTAPGILSSALEKLGYIRGGCDDGGCIYDFTKDFRKAGVVVSVNVEGIFVRGGFDGEAELISLSFACANANGDIVRLRIDQVPSVLLAEAYADFLAVAAVCGRPRA